MAWIMTQDKTEMVDVVNVKLSDPDMQVGKMSPDKLKQARLDLGYRTRAALAKVLGVSKRAVDSWEEGWSPVPRWLPTALLEIKNFLKIESLVMDLSGAPIHILVGANEAGKSSIRDAIQYCLTGQARGLKTHQDQAYLIREGAKAAEVAIKLAEGRVISRKKTPKTAASVIGPVPNDQVMAALLCDPMTFLSWPDDQRRQILFRLMPGLNPTAAEIAGRLSIAYDEPEDGNHILELAKLAASPGFKAAEEEAVTRRRIAKRLRDEAKVEEPKTRAAIGGKVFILPDIQQAEVQTGLEKLQASRDELIQKRGMAYGEVLKLPDLQRELANLEGNPIDPPKTGEIESLQTLIEASRSIVVELQKQVDALVPGKAPKFYPADCSAFPGSGIPCPKAGEMAISGQEAPDQAKTEKLRADLKAEKEQVIRLEADLQQAQAKQEAFEEYPKKRLYLAAKVARLKEQATATAELDREIAGLGARIQVGRDLMDAVRTFWRQKDAVDAAKAKLATADKEAVLYDTLAKALAPEGIPSRLIAEALKPINDLLQTAAAHLFTNRTLALNKDIEIELSGSPYVTLSKSAKFRVGVALQYALAKLAGARLLMLDEADILDPVNRGRLIDFLLAVHQDFDTILVFAASDHADPSPVPEIQVWWLDEGRISLVMAKQAA